MIPSLLTLYGQNLDYARKLVDDVPHDGMCAQPAAGVNHPAWILGHLAITSDRIAMYRLLGEEPLLPEAWRTLYDEGTEPRNGDTGYPAKHVLLRALEQSHARVEAALRHRPPDTLGMPTPDAEFAALWPTLGMALTYVLVGHEQNHLGQLSAWRRFRGLPAV